MMKSKKSHNPARGRVRDRWFAAILVAASIALIGAAIVWSRSYCGKRSGPVQPADAVGVTAVDGTIHVSAGAARAMLGQAISLTPMSNLPLLGTKEP